MGWIYLDFLRFYFHNSNTQLALHIAAFALIYVAVEGEVSSFSKGLVTLFVVLLFGAAFVQTLLLFLNKRLLAYKELTKLLLLTKKMEKELEEQGASGKGLYEKASSISHLLPSGLLEEVFFIAESRNRAIHADPSLKNPKELLMQTAATLKKIKKIDKNSQLYFWVTNAVVLFVTLLVGGYFLERFFVGEAILLTLLSYYLNLFISHKIGYKRYLLLFFILAALTLLLAFESPYYGGL